MNAPNQLSFLPDDYLALKAQRRTNIICCGLFLIVMGAIGSAFVITERSVATVEVEHKRIEAEYTEAAKRIEIVQRMQEKQRKMAHQAELAASLLEKVPRSFVLAEVTNAMPSGVSLLDFKLDAKKNVPTAPRGGEGTTAMEKKRNKAADANAPAAPPQPTSYDVSMKLTGVAVTDVQVAQFITKLNQSKYLKDVNLIITDEYEQETEKLRRFQIELTLNPTAEVQADQKLVNTVSVPLSE